MAIQPALCLRNAPPDSHPRTVVRHELPSRISRAGVDSAPHRTGGLECEIWGDNITAMATDAEREFILAALAPICEPLHEALTKGSERALDHFKRHDMSVKDFAPFVAHLTRGHVINILCDKKLGDWRVARRRPNGQALLHNGAMNFRLLRPNHEGAIPAPGPNRARIDYYRNPNRTLFGPSSSKLIGIWTFDEEIGQPEVRVVRPIGAWKNGQKARLDLDFILPEDPDELNNLEFVPTDEGLTLPIAFEEGDGGGVYGTGG